MRRWKGGVITTWIPISPSYANGTEMSIKSAHRYKSTSGDLVMLQQHLRTVHGEELPYVLGDPLDTDSRGRYNIREMLFSEAIMNWWCSFAYIGWVAKGEALRNFYAMRTDDFKWRTEYRRFPKKAWIVILWFKLPLIVPRHLSSWMKKIQFCFFF